MKRKTITKSDIKQGRSIMKKIQMTTPLVEMDGDEMTRILWNMKYPIGDNAEVVGLAKANVLR